MELLLIAALALFAISRTVRLIARDGLGTTPPEPSAADWAAGACPSRAYIELTRLR